MRSSASDVASYIIPGYCLHSCQSFSIGLECAISDNVSVSCEGDGLLSSRSKSTWLHAGSLPVVCNRRYFSIHTRPVSCQVMSSRRSQMSLLYFVLTDRRNTLVKPVQLVFQGNAFLSVIHSVVLLPCGVSPACGPGGLYPCGGTVFARPLGFPFEPCCQVLFGTQEDISMSIARAKRL